MELNSAEGSEEIHCSICWQDGGDLVESGCPSQHSFHSTCLEAWLEESNRCPYCQQTIIREIRTKRDFFKVFNLENGKIEYFRDIFNNLSEEVQLECVKTEYHLFQLLKEHLKTPELCCLAVAHYGYLLEFVPDEIKTPEMCIMATMKIWGSIHYYPKDLKTKEFYLEVIKSVPWVTRQLAVEINTSDFCVAVVKQNPKLYDQIPSELRTLKFYKKIAHENRFLITRFPKRIQSELNELIS
ncbi:MAG: RING finger domain-containing protein [Patescibacteria group bacterium]